MPVRLDAHIPVGHGEARATVADISRWNRQAKSVEVRIRNAERRRRRMLSPLRRTALADLAMKQEPEVIARRGR